MKALPTVIEEAVAARIFEFAGVTGTDLDASLPIAQRFKYVRASEDIEPQEVLDGPFCKVILDAIIPGDAEFGDTDGDGRSMVFYAGLTVLVATGPKNSEKAARDEAWLLEEIVRGHLGNFLTQAEVSYGGGRETQLAGALWDGSEPTMMSFPSRQRGAFVGEAVPTVGNHTPLTIISNGEVAYEGNENETYLITIVTPNTVPNALTGLTFTYEDSNGVSVPIVATSGWNTLNRGVQILFALNGGTAVAGDSWTISAVTNSPLYFSYQEQSWLLTLEQDAVY